MLDSSGFALVCARVRPAVRVGRRLLVALGVAYLVLAWRVVDVAAVPLSAASTGGFDLFASSFWGLWAVWSSAIVAVVVFVVVSLAAWVRSVDAGGEA